jgi:hypothetical protein
MFKKINVIICVSFLAAAVSCQTNDENNKSNSDPALDQDIAVMTESALAADNGEEGTDIADAYKLGTGYAITDNPTINDDYSHYCHRPKFGLFQSIDIKSTWKYFSCNEDVQENYDPLTTGRVELVSDASGSLDLPRIEKTFSRHAEIEITGLCQDNKDFTVNGIVSSESKMTFTANKTEEEKNYSVKADTVIDGIVFSADKIRFYPLSGTITCHMVIDKTKGDAVIIHVVKTVMITFNGTAKPKIEILKPAN